MTKEKLQVDVCPTRVCGESSTLAFTISHHFSKMLWFVNCLDNLEDTKRCLKNGFLMIKG